VQESRPKAGLPVIERVWEDLHANVTRNHTCRTMRRLMRRVYYYLYRRLRQLRRQCQDAAA
jgi:hypothetical protein